MICKKCGYDMLDARPGGLCAGCENQETGRIGAWACLIMSGALLVASSAVLYSAVVGLLKFAALLKWVLQ